MIWGGGMCFVLHCAAFDEGALDTHLPQYSKENIDIKAREACEARYRRRNIKPFRAISPDSTFMPTTVNQLLLSPKSEVQLTEQSSSLLPSRGNAADSVP
jgi:hypothetical protein